MSKADPLANPVTEAPMPAGKQLRPSHAPLRSRSTLQHGFIYVAVLVAMFLVSLGSQAVMQQVSQQAQREREEALLHIGATYAQAIGAYYQSTPGSVKRWPRSLQDLLEDKRQLQIRRHIREIYPDPITHQADWEPIPAPDGGIQGVRSRSTKAPIRSGPVAIDDLALPPVQRYTDWAFIYQP